MAKKRLQKWLAFSLAVSMLMGTTAMAVDSGVGPTETTGEVIVESKLGGGEERVDVNISISPNGNGGQTEVSKTPEGGDQTESGLTVQFESTETKDDAGEVIDGESSYTANNSDNTYRAEGGSETETKQVSPGITVDIPLTADDPETEDVDEGTNTVTDDQKDETVPTDEGDNLKSENPAIYDQTTTTVLQQGSVSVTNNGTTVTSNSGLGGEYESEKEIDVDAVNPEWNSEKENVKAPATKAQFETVEAYKAALQNKPEDYDFLYTGYGEDSLYGAGWGFWNGDVYSAATGTQQFQMTDLSDPTVLEKENWKEYLDIHTAYCADVETGSISGFWYQIENLEDADYYKVNGAEDHIRAIAMNGYWGAVGTEKDTDGNDVPKTGSLDAMKKMLQDAQANGDEETKALLADIDFSELTEGEALTATQMAIWKYGNPYEAYTDEDGDEYEINLTANTMDYHWVSSGLGHDWRSAAGKWSWYDESTNALGLEKEEIDSALARINTVYEYLIGLSMTAEEAGTTEIINEAKFIDEMSMAVGEKTKENADGNGNDAYNVDLTFSLVVAPSQENDDLIVKVINSEGEVVSTARIAGDGTNDVGFSELEKTTDANGKTSYTMTGLELIEGSNTKFNLKLEGAQYLEQGVYVYSSQIRDYDLDKNGVIEERNQDWECERNVSSQTFVGIAEGYKSVDISMEIDLSFDVEESVIKTERVWRTEWVDDGDDDDIIPPTGDDDDDTPKGDDDDDDTTIGDDDVPKDEFPGDDDNDTDVIPEEDTPKAEIPAEDIPEEDVPLADVPKTGDVSALWFALSALSGAGLVGLNLIGKKREDEE